MHPAKLRRCDQGILNQRSLSVHGPKLRGQSLRVLTITGDLTSMGGLDRCQLAIARGLDHRDCEIDLVYRTAGDFYEDWRLFANRVVRIPAVNIDRRRPITSLPGFIKSVLTTRTLRPDIVYTHHLSHLDLGAAASVLSRRKLVSHIHNVAPASLGHAGTALTHRVTRFIAVSHATANLWIKLGLPSEKVDVVHNGVDISQFAPASPERIARVRKDLGIPKDSFVALFAGRIVSGKGIDVLIDVWVRLASPPERAILVVCGTASFDLGQSAGNDYLRALQAGSTENIDLAGAPL